MAPSADMSATPQTVVDQYLHWAEHRKGLRPLSIRSYRNTLGLWLDWLDGRPLDSVAPEDLEEFAARPRRGTNLGSAATRRREIVSVKQFYTWAVERGHVATSVVSTAVAPRVLERDPKPIPDHLWAQVWNSLLTPDDRLWLGLGYFAGLRRFEIVTIPPTAVDDNELRFERKGGGTSPVEYAAMCRVVASHKPWVAEHVDDWVAMVRSLGSERHRERFLWPDSRGDSFNDAQRLNKRLVRVLSGLGWPPNAFTPHCLRHSCATNLLQAGVEPVVIADLLGHSDVGTTRRYMRSSGQLGRWERTT